MDRVGVELVSGSVIRNQTNVYNDSDEDMASVVTCSPHGSLQVNNYFAIRIQQKWNELIFKIFTLISFLSWFDNSMPKFFYVQN